MLFTSPNHNMLSHSNLVCILLAFASCHVSSAVVPGSEVVDQLEADPFEVPKLSEGEKMTETRDANDEEEAERIIIEAHKVAERRETLLPAGWRRLRFRQSRKVPIPTCPFGGRGPGPMTP